MNFPYLLSCFCGCFLVGVSCASNDKLLKPTYVSPIPVLTTEVQSRNGFNFRQEFRDLVQEAISKDLHKLFSAPSEKRSKMLPLERYIFKEFEGRLKGPAQWSYILRNSCNGKLIFGMQFTKVDEVIIIGIKRILKAEGVNFDKLFPVDNGFFPSII